LGFSYAGYVCSSQNKDLGTSINISKLTPSIYKERDVEVYY